jgi:hypothetical protein
LASKADIKDETIKALMFIEYGRHRGFPAEELLVHEITSSAFFLVDKDGYVPVGDRVVEAMSRNRCKRPDNSSTNQSLYYRLHGDG